VSLETKISANFEKFDAVVGYLIPDWGINGTLRLIFSKTSILIHTAWFIYWFAAHLDTGLLTNIVSLEAIYVGILIGIQQLRHHKVIKKSLEDKR